MRSTFIGTTEKAASTNAFHWVVLKPAGAVLVPGKDTVGSCLKVYLTEE